MAWIYLIIAGVLEVAWAIALKYSDSWTKLVPSVLMIVFMIVGIFFLSLSVRTLPLGTAYAVWTGIGTIGTVLYGMMFFNEPVEIIRIVFIMLIIIGIVGLKLVSQN